MSYQRPVPAKGAISLVTLIALLVTALVTTAGAFYERRPVAEGAEQKRFWAAHRGGHSKTIPENSRASLRYSISHRADFIEVDFRLTSPNPVDISRTEDPVCSGPKGKRFWILMHDDTVARTTNVKKVHPGRAHQDVSRFTCQEIKNLRLVARGERKTGRKPSAAPQSPPTLDQFLSWVDKFEKKFKYTKARYIIEYKGENTTEFVSLYDIIKAKRPEWVDPDSNHDKAVFMAFAYNSVAAPFFDAGWDTTDRTQDGAELAAVLNAPEDSLPQREVGVRTNWRQVYIRPNLITRDLVDQAKELTPYVGTWGLQSRKRVRKAAKAGINVFTVRNVNLVRRKR